MGHNGHGIKLYGVAMILMENLHAGGQSNLGNLSLLHRPPNTDGRSPVDGCVLYYLGGL